MIHALVPFLIHIRVLKGFMFNPIAIWKISERERESGRVSETSLLSTKPED